MTLEYYNYRIYITPLIRAGVYGDTVDVTQDIDITDFVKRNGLQSVNREIDNGDYDFGIFVFGDVTINAINFSRRFNDHRDACSIFPYSRDLAKVEVRLYDDDGAYTVRFRGLVDEESTRDNIANDTVRIKVLSLDSIFKKVEISGGSVATGDTFNQAIRKILNVPEITNILGFDANDVNVRIDGVVDDGDYFSSISVDTAINDLLLASNSILIINENDEIIVKPRTESGVVYELFGRGDIYNREDILSISEGNDGRQRAFSSIVLNDIEVKSDAWIEEYGYKQKSINLGFLTDSDNINLIAQGILDDFEVPKREITISCLTRKVANIQLLDAVKIHYDYRVQPYDGDELALTGQAITGQAKLARTFGSHRILPNIKWKVIEIQEKPSSLTTVLKLRQAGNKTNDGYFDDEAATSPSLDFSQADNSQYIGMM